MRGLHRSRDGLVFGVCSGVAKYLDVKVLWIRAGVIAAAVFAGFWPAAAGYVLAAVLISAEPAQERTRCWW